MNNPATPSSVNRRSRQVPTSNAFALQQPADPITQPRQFLEFTVNDKRNSILPCASLFGNLLKQQQLNTPGVNYIPQQSHYGLPITSIANSWR